MTDLIFEAADTRRVVEHALAAPAHRGRWVDYVNGQDVYEPVGPCVVLAHDAGMYLMSNGLPPDEIGTQPRGDEVLLRLCQWVQLGRGP